MAEFELEEAIERSTRNRASRWPERGAPNRLEPECWPELNPGFNLVPGSTVFAIGSCFARSVELHLMGFGFDVPTRTFLEKNPGAEHLTGDDILNKYTPASIYQELLWTKRIRDRDGEVSDADIEPFLLALDNGNVVDLQRRSMSPFGVGREDALLQRRSLYELFEKVFDSDVVVITLGTIECWLDRATGQFVEFGTYMRKHNDGNRFAFKRLTFQEAYEFTRKSIDLIDETGTKNVLITASPVSLARTFTADDVIVANSYSKSVLRAVAGQIAEECPNVDYFPSYENVMLTKQNHVWANDLTHIEGEFVGRIMTRLCEKYISRSEGLTEAFGDYTKRLNIVSLVANRRFDEAREIFETLVPTQSDSRDIRYVQALAEMHLHFGIREKALAEATIVRTLGELAGERACYYLLRCAKVFEAAGHTREAAETREGAIERLGNAALVTSLIRKLMGSGALEDARAIMAHIEARLSDRFELLDFAALSHKTLGDFAAAERIYRFMLKSDSKNGEILGRLGQALFHQNKLEQAVSLLENSLALEPNNSVIFERLISILFELKRFDDAEKHARRFIAAAPLNPVGHLHLASSLRRRRLNPEALVHARRAAELEPGNERYRRYVDQLSMPAPDTPANLER